MKINKKVIKWLSFLIPVSSSRKAFRKRFEEKEQLPLSVTIREILPTSIIENKGENNEIILIKQDGTKENISYIEGLRVEFLGNNSKIVIHEPYNFLNCVFRTSDNCYIEVNSTTHRIKDFFTRHACNKECKIIIGKDFSCVGTEIILCDAPGKSVCIGEDCMFSKDIIVRCSDGHSIFDKNGNLINYNEDVKIGNHVWVSQGVRILKGSNIPNNSVVGAGAIFTKNSYNPKEVKISWGGESL